MRQWIVRTSTELNTFMLRAAPEALEAKTSREKPPSSPLRPCELLRGAVGAVLMDGWMDG